MSDQEKKQERELITETKPANAMGEGTVKNESSNGEQGVQKSDAPSQEVTGDGSEPVSKEQDTQMSVKTLSGQAEEAVTKPQAASVPPRKPAATPRPVAKKPVEDKPLEPSRKQPWLDKFVVKLKDLEGSEHLEDAFINRANLDLPTLVIKGEWWRFLALHLRNHSDCQFHYVQNFSSVDYETHLEVVVHLFSFPHKERLGVRIKVDRTEAKADSVADIWDAANWNEREAYDLMGITFEGHPDLRRIMLTDQWVGHPLRKDYVPYDEGV
ncbi:NADH:ubiquinone oxidoreductase subunit (chain C) [Thermoactinomyces sp. DSM 45891]|uniref:NADH-quinone oxidoreductase subunit C n=1 Tax=Thermoactinomyces sp. DSM 45891 TaxID=1761907 RepID=UPI000917426C|nr:NADH-quinone oxidoreductase subunit C [Thermoactinomyces sp. DSM 45891]SFX24066.1 NADH:ubiquinone oxidoreductase subunit (chain C) [Thermoactinomyces sp. DSM 45891]